MYCQINHRVLPLAEASLPVTDLGLLRGYAAFDYFRFREKTPLFADQHLSRLTAAARYLGIALPLSTGEVKEAIMNLLHKNEMDEGAIRLVLTGGSSVNAYEPGDPTLIITTEHFQFPSAALYEQGIKVLLHDWVRPMPEIKSTFYPEGIRLLPAIREAEAYDVLFCKEEYLSELTRSNFFIIDQQGTLVTSDRDILKGITRHNVLELAAKRMPVEVRPLHVSELAEATEAFITGTTRRILPVVQVAEMPVGNRRPGALTQALMHDLLAFEEAHLAGHKTHGR